MAIVALVALILVSPTIIRIVGIQRQVYKLSSGTVDECRDAAGELARLLGEGATPCLLDALPDNPEDIGMDHWVFEILLAFEKRGLPYLIKGLNHEKPGSRYVAAICIGKLGWLASEKVLEISVHIDDSNRYVRAQICSILGRIGRDPRFVHGAALISKLDDRDELVRDAAIASLALLGTWRTDVLKSMVAGFQRGTGKQRCRFMQVFGRTQILNLDKTSRILLLSAIGDSLRSNSRPEILAALEACGEIGRSCRSVGNDVAVHLSSPDRVVRYAAVLAVDRMGLSDNSVSEVLERIARDDEWPHIRLSAEEALRRLKRH